MNRTRRTLASSSRFAILQVLDQLPADLQLLGPSKKREPDANIRLILAETLVLLGTTRACRESMRRRGVYEVIKAAHLAETNQKVSLREQQGNC